MKILIIVLMLCVALLSVSATQQKPTLWEYKFDDKCSEKRTNEMASQGWELFSMSMGSWREISTPYCVFRRQR